MELKELSLNELKVLHKYVEERIKLIEEVQNFRTLPLADYSKMSNKQIKYRAQMFNIFFDKDSDKEVSKV